VKGNSTKIIRGSSNRNGKGNGRGKESLLVEKKQRKGKGKRNLVEKKQRKGKGKRNLVEASKGKKAIGPAQQKIQIKKLREKKLRKQHDHN